MPGIVENEIHCCKEYICTIYLVHCPEEEHVYVRMSHWSCKRENWGEDAELFKNGAVPMMQSHPGFVQAMLLGEDNAEQRIALTIWEDPESYRRFIQNPDLETITSMFAHMYVGGKLPGPVREYVVRAQGAAG